MCSLQFLTIQCNFIGGRSSDSLLKVNLTIISNDACAEAYGKERKIRSGIIDSQLCAGDARGEKDTCQVR